MKLYEKLIFLRRNSGFTQEFVCNYLSCSRTQYNYIENNKKQLTLTQLYKIVELYGVSFDYLLDENFQLIVRTSFDGVFKGNLK